MFWLETFLDKRRAEWLKSIAKFQYWNSSEGRWVDAVINDKHIEGDTLKIITTMADNGKAAKITSVRLIDRDGDTAGQMNESIVKTATQGVLTLWEFPLYEIA